VIKSLVLILSIFLLDQTVCFADEGKPEEILRIDSIVINKNWRTRDKIILRELEFGAGSQTTIGAIDTSISKIWNIGNFAEVSYEIDTLEDGRHVLYLLARDALTIVPILSFKGSRKDYRFSLGVNDHNFLGQNIGMDIVGTYGTNVRRLRLGVSIPRQLLYKNMSVSAQMSYGYNKDYRFEDGERTSAVGYERIEISGSVSNPWHEDYGYRFSPDIGFKLFRHATDSGLVDAGLPVTNYTINYFHLSVGESIGLVNRKRHQEDGYLAGIGIGIGMGLDPNSPFYYNIGASAAFHKLFNPVVQFSAKFSTGYISTDIPSLIYYIDAGDVKGILTGEIAGQSYYTAYLGGHFTYINRSWFAIEQSFYLNWGQGTMRYGDLYRRAPVLSAGSGLNFMIPMIPWLYLRLFFTWSPNNNNWFNLEF
jgi:outer membrane protein assembly factor BamA